MKKQYKTKNNDSCFFWNTASDYLNRELPNIRKKSSHTISAYRISLNLYIDYLEIEKNISRKDLCYDDFNKDNLKDYMQWMHDIRGWKEKTCNLRITAIKSLLSYASEESVDIMSIFINSKTVQVFASPASKIEFFENYQLKALLDAPDMMKRIDRRNRMLLILAYDAALRISEVIELKLESLHFNAEIPYVAILGKGLKYRNVPLMKKTVLHLKKYISEFHMDDNQNKPLFYATTHGSEHCLSDDTIQGILKKYSSKCSENIQMPESAHFHMLRKTRAMDLYQAQCPLAYIQQLLGHEHISTTSGFYAFATLKTLNDAIEKVNPTTIAE